MHLPGRLSMSLCVFPPDGVEDFGVATYFHSHYLWGINTLIDIGCAGVCSLAGSRCYSYGNANKK